MFLREASSRVRSRCRFGFSRAAARDQRSRPRADLSDPDLVRIIRAAEEAGLAGLKEHLIGPTAIAYSTEDPIAPAKILQDFADDGGKMIIKTGFMDGKILGADEVTALAKLPSREDLLGKVVGSVQSPLYGLHGALNGLLRGLVGALSAIEKQKAEGGENA